MSVSQTLRRSILLLKWRQLDFQYEWKNFMKISFISNMWLSINKIRSALHFYNYWTYLNGIFDEFHPFISKIINYWLFKKWIRYLIAINIIQITRQLIKLYFPLLQDLSYRIPWPGRGSYIKLWKYSYKFPYSSFYCLHP